MGEGALTSNLSWGEQDTDATISNFRGNQNILFFNCLSFKRPGKTSNYQKSIEL